MSKFDQLAKKILGEDAPMGNRYYVYEVMVSGMHGEVVQVENQYELKAASIEDALEKAYSSYKEQVGDSEYFEIPPKTSDKIAKVITGEESLIVVSVQPLSEEQIDDVVYGEE